jgi:hypothetical protein
MINVRLLACAAVVPLAVAVVCGQDHAPELPERVVRFEVSEQPLELRDFTARPGQVWPKFAATLGVALSRSAHGELFEATVDARLRPDSTEKLLNTSAAATFSEEQLEFLKMSAWLRHRSDLTGGPCIMGRPCYFTLYAVSERDARQMVAAVFEVLDAPRRTGFEEMKGSLLGWQAKLKEAEQSMRELQRGLERAREAHEAARKLAGYRSREAAEQDITRLDVSLRSVDVAIAGINAKIAMIERLNTGQGGTLDESTRLMLERLRVEQDIELAGALAQKQVIEEHRARAEAFLRTADEKDAANNKVHELQMHVRTCESRISQWQKRLEDPDSSLGKVSLIGNVTIQAIAYPGE